MQGKVREEILAEIWSFPNNHFISFVALLTATAQWYMEGAKVSFGRPSQGKVSYARRAGTRPCGPTQSLTALTVD